VIELKRGEIRRSSSTTVQADAAADTFGVNMVALLDGQPRVLNLKQMLEAFSRTARGVTRRTVFDLREARKKRTSRRAAIALSNVDEIIELIKKSQPGRGEVALMAKTWNRSGGGDAPARRGGRLQAEEIGRRSACRRTATSSPTQAQASGDAPRAPHGLEQDRSSPSKELIGQIADLLDILASPRGSRRSSRGVEAIKTQYGDQRKSEIVEQAEIAMRT